MTNKVLWAVSSGVVPGNLEDVFDTIPNGVKLGQIVTAESPYLGSGRFVFLKGVANLAAGHWVEYNPLTGVVTRTLTALKGNPVAVALANPTAAQYGWYQISGIAQASVGTPLANNRIFFNTAGAAQTGQANGLQIVNAMCLTVGAYVIDASLPALGASEALVNIQSPFIQGQIV